MTDYTTDVSLLRGDLVRMLGDNDEQFLYVITDALDYMDVHSLIADGNEHAPDIDTDAVAAKLRLIADYLEGEGQ